MSEKLDSSHLETATNPMQFMDATLLSLVFLGFLLQEISELIKRNKLSAARPRQGI